MYFLPFFKSINSAGDSTYRIGLKEHETAISQVFLCIYPEVFSDQQLQKSLINEIIKYTHDVTPVEKGKRTYYPGERSAMAYKSNLKKGMKVNKDIWGNIINLLK